MGLPITINSDGTATVTDANGREVVGALEVSTVVEQLEPGQVRAGIQFVATIEESPVPGEGMAKEVETP